jgi:hypothetical protein
MKKGDLVRPKPGTCEGDEKALGLAIIVSDPIQDVYNPTKYYCKVEWIKTRGRKWTFYLDDLILVSQGKAEE